MFNYLGILCGFISSFFIILFVSMYILRDLYRIIPNMNIKKIINNLLPIISRYNNLFLMISFLFGIIHAIALINITSSLNFGYIVLIILFMIFKIRFLPSKNKKYFYEYPLLSYLLLANLAIHFIV